MQKRIYRAMAAVTSFGVLLISVCLCFLFYRQFESQVKEDLREWTTLFLNDSTGTALNEFKSFKPNDIRITLIGKDGSVLYESVSDKGKLENHLGREEVQQALKQGEGESSRISDTMNMRTYYHAVLLTDGSVLRMAKTTSSILGVYLTALPFVILIILLIVLIEYRAAYSLTKKIVAPINEVDLAGDLYAPYDELSPFIRTIAHQRKKISEDMLQIKSGDDTISTMVENMEEGVVILDSHNKIISINKSAASIWNADSEAVGGDIRMLSRDEALLEALDRLKPGDTEDVLLEKGSRIYRAIISSVADRGAVIFFLDVTEKFRDDKMRREFSANVSHELKTPLTSIYGNAEMLSGGLILDEDKPLFYKKIKDEAARMISLVEDIMMISKLDESKHPGEPEAAELNFVAAECIEALSRKASEENVKLYLTGKAVITANRSMIYELFYNLIDNAIKYNKSGGEVRIVISQIGEQTAVNISDTGIGIPKDAQSRIFERFFRVDKSRSKKTGGTGLGLAIVKHILMACGGKITLRSEEGIGSEFVIVFSD